MFRVEGSWDFLLQYYSYACKVGTMMDATVATMHVRGRCARQAAVLPGPISKAPFPSLCAGPLRKRRQSLANFQPCSQKLDQGRERTGCRDRAVSSQQDAWKSVLDFAQTLNPKPLNP